MVLTEKAVDMCYQGVDRATGDARVAFVAGHELSHLFNRDFIRSELSENKNHDTGSKEKDKSSIIIPKIKVPDNRKEKELRADIQGLVFALLAGYNPKIIIGKDNFLQRWHTAEQDSHPAPDERLEKILLKREELLHILDLFYIGTRLCQLGRYDDALAFLKAFNKKFPSREVYNSIGLIFYQKAVQKLAECYPETAYKFKLANSLDREIILAESDPANKVRGKNCKKESLFDDAMRYFKDACDKDRFYIPSRINYSSALIMKGKYATAEAVIKDEIMRIKNDYPNFMSQRDYQKTLGAVFADRELVINSNIPDIKGYVLPLYKDAKNTD